MTEPNPKMTAQKNVVANKSAFYHLKKTGGSRCILHQDNNKNASASTLIHPQGLAGGWASKRRSWGNDSERSRLGALKTRSACLYNAESLPLRCIAICIWHTRTRSALSSKVNRRHVCPPPQEIMLDCWLLLQLVAAAPPRLSSARDGHDFFVSKEIADAKPGRSLL